MQDNNPVKFEHPSQKLFELSCENQNKKNGSVTLGIGSRSAIFELVRGPMQVNNPVQFEHPSSKTFRVIAWKPK